MKVDDLHIIGIIRKKEVVNIQELCRILNGRDFKWCHRKHEKYKDVDDRMDNQFVKQCNECQVHYRQIHKQVMRLIKEGRIQSDKRIFYDRIDDDGTKRTKGPGRRRDLYRFLFVDHDAFKKKILVETLDGYK